MAGASMLRPASVSPDGVVVRGGLMRPFWSGTLVGLGVGWLVGWSLGASRLVPAQGWPLWVGTVGGIVLIALGTAGRRPHPNPESGIPATGATWAVCGLATLATAWLGISGLR